MNILIKFSGEYFNAKDDLTKEGYGFLDQSKENNLDYGYIVVGGGNRIRGNNCNFARNAADRLGVLSTIMNGMILKECLKNIGMDSVIYSHFNDFGKKYSFDRARKDFNKKKWVILTSGLGDVGFISTDLSSVIKALELKVNAMIKITKVGGVFDKDPLKYQDAALITSISYKDVIEKKFSVLDMSAVAIAAENNLSIGVVSIDNFVDFLNNKECGSIIGDDWR